MIGCTQTITGRLYPSPANRDFFMLDFVNQSGKRVEDTKFILYETGVHGEDKRSIMATQGSLPERRGTVDLYTLSPRRTVEIVAEDGTLLAAEGDILHL